MVAMFCLKFVFEFLMSLLLECSQELRWDMCVPDVDRQDIGVPRVDC